MPAPFRKRSPPDIILHCCAIIATILSANSEAQNIPRQKQNRARPVLPIVASAEILKRRFKFYCAQKKLVAIDTDRHGCEPAQEKGFVPRNLINSVLLIRQDAGFLSS